MSDAPIEIERCITFARDGDESASRELITHLYPLVHKMVCSHLPKRADIDDLCQAIFVKVFRNLSQYSGKVPIEHWVSRIAVNTCLNQLRSEKARPELRYADLSEQQLAVVENLNSTEESETCATGSEAKELLETLLQCLAPAERMLIQLLHLEEKSVSEISSLTGWSRPLVKVRAFRARQKLKKKLASLQRKERT